MKISQIEDYDVLEISGPDSESFLQDQLTCDVLKIKNNQSNFSAYCNYQGRVLSLLYIYKFNSEKFWMILPKALLEKVLKTLTHYRLFAKINFNQIEVLIYGVIGQPETGINIQIGEKIYYVLTENPLKLTSIETIDQNTWRLELIKNKIPAIYPETSLEFTPHMLNLQNLNALSFTKGCYLGQEIIARSEHLGKVKRGLYQIKILTQEAIQPGFALTDATGDVIGEILIAAFFQEHAFALAVLKIDIIKQNIYFINSSVEIL